MNTPIAIGKAIWRKPNDVKIYSISSGEGDDEFIIAPFNKTEPTFHIKGRIGENNLQSIKDLFSNIQPANKLSGHSTPKEHYIQSVENAVGAIKAGLFEKAVLARQYVNPDAADVQSLFIQLEIQYKNAFVYCFMLENGLCMIGATPETLLEKKGSTLTTEALGGTAQVNGYSQKEYLEHQQIITDISNKLAAKAYSYSHSDTAIKIAGNVSHLSTLFNVKSQSVSKDLELLQSLHPTSAVCGLPFQPAYDFIIEQEDFNRNYYAGYLGIKQGNDFNFYVNLRCAEIFENGAILYSGAGINKDSVAESEWMETTNKLDTLLMWMA